MTEVKLTPKQIQVELRKVLDEALCHREALAALEARRLSLIKQLKEFSSSITSSSVVGAPGIIQGSPPNGSKQD